MLLHRHFRGPISHFKVCGVSFYQLMTPDNGSEFNNLCVFVSEREIGQSTIFSRPWRTWWSTRSSGFSTLGRTSRPSSLPWGATWSMGRRVCSWGSSWAPSSCTLSSLNDLQLNLKTYRLWFFHETAAILSISHAWCFVPSEGKIQVFATILDLLNTIAIHLAMFPS